MQDTYDKIDSFGGPLEEQTRARLNAANQAYAAAQQRLDQLKAGATKNELGVAGANINATKAQLEQAKAQLDLLKAGATAEQIAVAEAGVKQAQVAVDTAKAQLDKLQLIAPFDGTIGTVTIRSGELAQAGQPIVTLGDLGSLRVETTDLSETDIARVTRGATGQRDVRRAARQDDQRQGHAPRADVDAGAKRSELHRHRAAGRDRSGAALGHDGVCGRAGE